MISLKVGISLLGIYRDTAIVSYSFMGTGGEIEQRGLSAVRITHQSNGDDRLLLFLLSLLRNVTAAGYLLGSLHLYHLGLLAAQTNLITHDVVFDRVLQRSVEQHFDGLSLDKSHLQDAFTEASVSFDFHDYSLLACM